MCLVLKGLIARAKGEGRKAIICLCGDLHAFLQLSDVSQMSFHSMQKQGDLCATGKMQLNVCKEFFSFKGVFVWGKNPKFPSASFDWIVRRLPTMA